MADQRDGGIAWTDATWNPIRGCSRISEGCRNCYAEVVAGRFSGPGLAYEGLAKQTAAGARWTGKVVMVEKHLYDPLRWTRPRRIFTNSMSDLFHESLSIEAIASVFAVMCLAPQHQFQVLTKRAERMRQVLNDPAFYRLVLRAADFTRGSFPRSRNVGISNPSLHPHANIWLGVSVEDQAAALARIPHLLETPAAVRWLSIEPQIGFVDLDPLVCPDCGQPPDGDADSDVPWCIECETECGDPDWLGIDGVNWVVIGGESGTGARPFNLGWARSLVRQCKGAGVPAFVKQLGGVPVIAEQIWRHEGPTWQLSANNRDRAGEGCVPLYFADRKGGDLDEWPEDLRVREFPEAPEATP